MKGLPASRPFADDTLSMGRAGVSASDGSDIAGPRLWLRPEPRGRDSAEADARLRTIGATSHDNKDGRCHAPVSSSLVGQAPSYRCHKPLTPLGFALVTVTKPRGSDRLYA